MILKRDSESWIAHDCKSAPQPGNEQRIAARHDRTARDGVGRCWLVGAGLSTSPVMVLGLLCLSQIGVSAMPPLFWPIPGAFLTGSSAAAGIAAINSVGNLSGFAGPYVMGYLKDTTGTFTIGLILLGVTALAGGIAAMALQLNSQLETAEPETAKPGAPAAAHY